jgi:hypothetical protein
MIRKLKEAEKERGVRAPEVDAAFTVQRGKARKVWSGRII